MRVKRGTRESPLFHMWPNILTVESHWESLKVTICLSFLAGESLLSIEHKNRKGMASSSFSHTFFFSFDSLSLDARRRKKACTPGCLRADVSGIFE